ncbi:hypothetical protein MD484_g6713, partial [Candolleomyces efflorescens]
MLEVGEFELYTITWTGRDVIRNVFPPPVPMWHGCLTRVHDSRRTLLAWIPAIVGSFLFFVATMIKFRESITHPSGQRVNILNDWSYVSPMIMVFFRDGAFYFIVITATICVKAFATIHREGWYARPALAWMYAMYSMAGAHMLLNLRRTGGKGTPTQIFTSDKSVITAMEFGVPAGRSTDTAGTLELEARDRH